MSSPRVSVLMLTFNRPKFISRAIESIVAQSFTNWELIVVHDGPNEEIAAILKGWEAREPRVRYIRRLEKGNIAQANNHGLRQARGEYVAVLDDDDYWIPRDKLERQVRFLDEHPDYAGCGAGAVCIDEQGRETMRYLKPERHEQIVARALVANPMVHSTFVYRHALAEQAGFYDESLEGFQDWDLCLKLARLGRIHNFQEHFLAYQIWEGGGSFAAQRRNTESALRIVRRHGGSYQGYPLALALALGYYAYARTPLWFRKGTFSALSRLKKSIFAQRGAAA
jgi:glycosyltransferase involved in cell wall biosynthesis